jgi:hypothetical protein
MKTSELTGAALDWAVAKCEEWPMGIWYDEDELPMIRDDEVPEYKPSTDWAQGGPIIEREKIALDFFEDLCGAGIHMNGELVHLSDGPTPLIAAMRCYLASKLSDEVEIPQELAA